MVSKALEAASGDGLGFIEKDQSSSNASYWFLEGGASNMRPFSPLKAKASTDENQSARSVLTMETRNQYSV